MSVARRSGRRWRAARNPEEGRLGSWGPIVRLGCDQQISVDDSDGVGGKVSCGERSCGGDDTLGIALWNALRHTGQTPMILHRSSTASPPRAHLSYQITPCYSEIGRMGRRPATWAELASQSAAGTRRLWSSGAGPVLESSIVCQVVLVAPLAVPNSVLREATCEVCLFYNGLCPTLLPHSWPSIPTRTPAGCAYPEDMGCSQNVGGTRPSKTHSARNSRRGLVARFHGGSHALDLDGMQFFREGAAPKSDEHGVALEMVGDRGLPASNESHHRRN